MDEYMGIVKLFAGNFAPRGWAFCQGQLLPIAQYTALFSLLGTTYGGDGRTTFALPNLQGSVPIGVGNHAGTQYRNGEVAGTPTVTITTAQMPMHTHSGQATLAVSASNSTDSTPATGMSIGIPGSSASRQFTPSLGFVNATPSVNLSTNIGTSVAGGSQPLSIMQPYVAMNYIICLQGLFPSRD